MTPLVSLRTDDEATLGDWVSLLPLAKRELTFCKQMDSG